MCWTLLTSNGAALRLGPSPGVAGGTLAAKLYKQQVYRSSMRRERGLACRIYKINSSYTREVKMQLGNYGKKTVYTTYNKGTDKEELTFSVKDTVENEQGSLYSIYLDKIIFLPDRDKDKLVVYTPTFKLQIFENTPEFKDHLVIYGPKTIDAGIKNAIKNQLAETSDQEVRDPLILLKIDFEKIQHLAEEFPNIQHFCIKGINDDRLQDVIIKGDMLEKTPQYKEFVLRKDTRGDVNFLGITMDDKLFYVGKDGSMYSRTSFSQYEMVKLVYSLASRISSRNSFIKPLDDYNN